MANRKKASKTNKLITQQETARIALERDTSKTHFPNPFDDPCQWIGQRFETPPWSKQKITEFQERLDSAFGGKDCLILAWSGERKYWDEFYTDWQIFGTPKGQPEKKPLLLFGQYSLNETDYVYITVPRWVILERLHGSQLADSWEESSWVEDDAMLGGKKRIRRDAPPESFYRVIRTIAQHDQYCCQRLWEADKRICYGKYREPDYRDVEYVGRTAEDLKRLGISQRNDAPRNAKTLQVASAATQHFMEQAAKQKTRAVQEMIMSDPHYYMGDVFKNYGITLSAPEIDRALKEGFKAQNDKENV